MPLIDVLVRAQEIGLLGPGPVEGQVAHAHGFAALVPDTPARFLDLGSGGGVPGLVLAIEAWPESTAVLLDAGLRRTVFLEEAIEELGLAPRVSVLRARAEIAGRAELRGTMDAVVARSFAAPAITAECAAPFLRPDGTLVVSEPPADESTGDRWSPAGLAELGLTDLTARTDPYAFRAFRLTTELPDRYPRREGIPTKRPLW